MKKEKKLEFLKKLIKFYRGLVTGSSESIKYLSEIQRDYPKEYKIIQEIKYDPSAVDEMVSEMSEEEKEIFFSIFMRATLLSKKTSNLFELSADEQRKLSEQLKEFGDFAEKKLNELLKIRKKKK